MLSASPSPAHPVPERRAASLERRLPLQMAGVLALVLASALALTYLTLAREALAGHQDRLDRSVRQLATVSANSVRAGRQRYFAVAGDPSVVAAARDGAVTPAARAALQRLVAPNDSGMPTELWTADGRRLAFFGRDLRAGVGPRAADEAGLAVPREGLSHVSPDDSLGIGWLYADGERVHFWIVAPVRDGGRPVGYVVQQRRIAANPQTERSIRELTGAAVAGYYRNPDRDFWAAIGGHPAAATVHDAAAGDAAWSRPTLGPLLHAEQAVEGTPLTLVLEVPRSQVLEGPRRTLLTLAGVGALLLGLGTALSWSVSRRLTRRLATLTGAAEALGRGDLGARAPVEGDDELARLARTFNAMAGEVARSNAELREARHTADAASGAKSDFLAVMSHELRTPLNAIGGYTELMAMGLRGPVTDAQQRDLERIRLAQQHLLGLVGAVLDMSRIERGQVAYDLAPVPLGPFLTGLDALVGPQAAAKQLRLVCEPCPPGLAAVADREKLRQIALNLLSNAIRYTPAGGTVTLEAEAEGEAVVLRVRDTGIGIPAERQAEIFEPFVQLDRSLTQPRDGVGLGLAISRDLARGMGGELSVCSRPGEGATFTLRLARGRVREVDDLYASGEVAVHVAGPGSAV